MTNENKPLDAEATEAELVARLKELAPQIVDYYNKDTLTPAEEAELEVLNSEKEKLTKLLGQKDVDGISAVLQVNAYGYDVSVLVNGSDIGIKGGMSEGSRLFNKEHYSYQLAAPNVLKLYVLEKGENTLAITYAKKEGETSALEGSVTLYVGREEVLKVPLTGDGSSIEKVVTLGV